MAQSTRTLLLRREERPGARRGIDGMSTNNPCALDLGRNQGLKDGNTVADSVSVNSRKPCGPCPLRHRFILVIQTSIATNSTST
uniref:Uncharacterized protein n=1 Tax=Mycena chlorophos TaxID=658473 RepID=A0ABQ0LJL1_MYCCL|nr:predicted protein [Mycena chlorophos]